MADIILHIIPAPSQYVNAFKGDDGLYTEPAVCLALVQTGRHQSIEAVAAVDGILEVLTVDSVPSFLGTWFVYDPDLEKLRKALGSGAEQKLSSDNL